MLIFFIMGGLTGLALWLSPSFAETGIALFQYARKSNWISSVKKDFRNQSYENYAKFAMKDNTWIVLAMNHDCCTGDGFNCVISKDSAGVVMIDEKKNFCGVESMCNQLNRLASDSMTVFYSELASIGLNLARISD